jgi:hypothetical protein
VILGLSLILCLLLWYFETPITASLAVALSGVLMESCILLALTLFFGVFSSPFLTVSFCLGVFIIGHWLDDLRFFAEKSDSQQLKAISTLVRAVIPDLERFNWRALVTYGDFISFNAWSMALINCLCWLVVLVSISAMVFNKRDFV